MESLSQNIHFANVQMDKQDVQLAGMLRPRHFGEYIGQNHVVQSLSVAVQAAILRNEPLDHTLFYGPPGLGKTTLAQIIAREMDSRIVQTSGPALERPADVVGILSNLDTSDVMFIDEIHRLSSTVEEYLYSAMEDFRVDFITGTGAYARTINLPIKRFTLIGSTTRAGMLSEPLRERFGIQYHLDFYNQNDLKSIVIRSSKILGVESDDVGADEIAKRSRGTPRIANRLLRRVRDYAQVKGQGIINYQIANSALSMEGIDNKGLDRMDRIYLNTIANNYNGGPAGIEAIAATINEEQNTLVDVVEPFLLKIGFVVRTSQGRRITPAGTAHLGVNQTDTTSKSDHQGSLPF